MAEVADQVVVLHSTFNATEGRWRSDVFATGGRKGRSEGGVELRNACVFLNLGVVAGSPTAVITASINGHNLPNTINVPTSSQRTVMASFTGSFLNDGGGNRLELRSQSSSVTFVVFDAVVHFRQNS